MKTHEATAPKTPEPVNFEPVTLELCDCIFELSTMKIIQDFLDGFPPSAKQISTNAYR